MGNKKKFFEKVKCDKCGSTTWMFLIKGHNDRVIRCNHCPEEVIKVMKLLARKYFKIFNDEE